MAFLTKEQVQKHLSTQPRQSREEALAKARRDTGRTAPSKPLESPLGPGPAESPTEPIPTGRTENSQPPLSDEHAAFQARCNERIEKAKVKMAAAMAEAKRRGVSLGEILPVH